MNRIFVKSAWIGTIGMIVYEMRHVKQDDKVIRRHLGLIGKRILEIITDSFGSSNT